jgi:hypothetical protein
MVRKRLWGWNGTDRDRFLAQAREVVEIAESPDTIFVRAQSVWNDLVPSGGLWMDTVEWDRLMGYRAIPKPRPPYQFMWIEAIATDHLGVSQRIAAILKRWEGPMVRELLAAMPPQEMVTLLSSAHRIVNTKFLAEYQGLISTTGFGLYGLDLDDNAIAVAVHPYDESDPSFPTEILNVRMGWVLHTIARMNCANAKLMPIDNGRPQKNHRHDKRPPSSVWHEIQVTAAPTIRYGAAPGGEEGETHVRFHWVRGHYADYTKGRGLFGKESLRKVFWIPEHQAGKEELGTVVSSYQVH